MANAKMSNEWIFYRRFDDSDKNKFPDAKIVLSKEGKRFISSSDISLIFPDWHPGKENVVFFGAHDDDIQLGAGLLTLAVIYFGGMPYYVIVTDGAGGYFDPKDKAETPKKRKSENELSSKILGVPLGNIRRLGYPDGNLNDYVNTEGRGKHNGLLVELTKEEGEHIDHDSIYRAKAAIYNASEPIWGELGDPISKIGNAIAYAVYHDFDPDLLLQAPKEALEKKIKSLKEFSSQKQVEGIIHRHGKPRENFSIINPPGYDPEVTFHRFISNK